MVQLLPGSPEQTYMNELRQIGETQRPLRGFVAFAAMTMSKPPRLFQTSAGRTMIAALLRTVLAFSSVVRRVAGREPSGMQRLIGNADILFCRELPAFVYDYEPDIAALRSVQVPWCLATGRDSLGRPATAPRTSSATSSASPARSSPVGIRCTSSTPKNSLAA
jgi:hypothetical protein